MLDLFSVNIDSNNDLLKIEDRRCLKHFSVGGLWLIGGGVIGYTLYVLLLVSSPAVAVFVGISVPVIALIIGAMKVSQLPYRRIYFFDKKQKSYRLIEITSLETQENAGKLDEIKRVRIDINKYESSENNSKTYGYQTVLVLDNFLAYDDSNLIPVEEESGNYDASSRIASAIADFLQLPIPEDNHLSSY